MTVNSECHECGGEYEKLTVHWAASDCSFPELDPHQHEVIKGLLMGDGYLDTVSANPRITVKMINQDYLEWLDGTVFEIIGTGVGLLNTAEESAARTKRRGVSPNAKAENYSDIYRWRTQTNPALGKYENWYGPNGKIWPESIKLSPETLRHWYCGDGCWSNKGPNDHIMISMSKERENKEKVEKMFGRVGFEISNWNEQTRTEHLSGVACRAVFSMAESERLWDYMGSAPPGFEYKWPEEYRT